MRNINFLVFNPGYNYLEILLAFNLNRYSSVKLLNKDINNIFTILDNIFLKYNLNISDIDFISCNIGPCPFTTLRSIISIINAFVYSLNIKTLPINGLELFLRVNSLKDRSNYISFFNAFSNDVYYSYYYDNKLKIGCNSIDNILNILNSEFQGQTLKFIGNGALFYKDRINSSLENSIIYDNLDYLLLNDLYLESLRLYQNNSDLIKPSLLYPLYLK
jgi:tRNA A37 threonylcarbamoyladenosine modification protein TsaB